jgi:hypothetical protein
MSRNFDDLAKTAQTAQVISRQYATLSRIYQSVAENHYREPSQKCCVVQENGFFMSSTTSRLTSVLLALTGIVAVFGLPISAARAQNQPGTPQQVQNAESEQLEPVTIVKSRGTGNTDQLTFKADAQISTVTAGKIIAHKKGTTLYSLNKTFPVTETNEPLYSLKGDFHLVGPSGWEYFGKDAELAMWMAPPGKCLSCTLARH